MQKFFELHRKEIITGAGALMFMIDGALAMFFIQSDRDKLKDESQSQKFYAHQIV